MRLLTRHTLVILHTSIIVCAATVVLSLSSTFLQRRGVRVLAASVAGSQLSHAAAVAENGTGIRPFRTQVPKDGLVNLRRRLAAMQWPDNETVTVQSQGVRSETMKELVRYWQSDYDWRRAEANLNALPQVMTTIDGLDIYFIHVRSKYPSALPLIITHAWLAETPGDILFVPAGRHSLGKPSMATQEI